MKRSVYLLIILLLSVGLVIVGCGQQESQPKSQPESQTSEPKKVDFPKKEITLIIPYNAGGGTDLVARMLAEGMEDELGVSIVPVNKGGAGSATGLQDTITAKPDGYTIVMAATPLVTLRTATGVDIGPDKFESIIGVNINDFALAVNSNSKWKTIEELVEYAKANPGKLKVGVTAPGGAWHTAGIAFGKAIGAEIELVPFGGGTADMMPALLGDHVPVGMMDVAEAVPHVKSGKIQVLAIGGENRYDIFPDVPTFSEKGIEIFRACAMRGLMAPKGTPQEVVNILYEAAKKAAAKQKFVEYMDSNACNIEIYNPSEWAKFLDEQYNEFIELSKSLK